MTKPTKTSVKKKTPVKKAVSKTIPKTSAKAVTTSKVRSFRISPNDPGFRTFKITRQTVYWVIIVSFIIFMQLWILSLQLETSNYIEQQIVSSEDM
jgi:hypothetical protein